MAGSILEKILGTLENPQYVRIKNRDAVEAKLVNLIEKGRDALQIISDFDMTLTRYHLNGDRCHSSYAVMDYSPLMPETYRTRAQQLTAQYYPIEINHDLSIEEKIPHMEDWYRASHNLIASCRIPKSQLRAMVADSRSLLRDNASSALKKLNEANVPVLVFSAGCGNILEEVLLRESVFYPNIKVVSNFMIFDDDEKVVEFREPVIHVFNKSLDTVRSQSSYFSKLKERTNIILLGDTLGDLEMSRGVPKSSVQLKIGFLNVKMEESLDTFMSHYDIVLVDDQSMDILNILLQHILEP